MPRPVKKPATPKFAADTPEKRSAKIIERDLAMLTGAELLRKYGKAPYRDAFFAYTGQNIEDVASAHNPFYHYVLAVWFDNADGLAMLSDQHRILADEILSLVMGEYDRYDGYLCARPRRSLKSTFAMAAMDWAAKRHWLVDGLDISQFYVHNQYTEATSRTETVKRKNQYHPYIITYFGDIALPQGEWGNRDEWNWTWRSVHGSVSDPSVRPMSIAGKKAGKGAHYRWLDDCEDEESRKSEAVRKSVSDGYDQLRQLEAPAFSREAFMDTPYHMHGLTLTLKQSTREDNEPRYKISWVPALTAADEPNFPNIRKLTVAGLAKERANEIARTGTDTFWYLQYMLEAHLLASQTMQWEWFRPITLREYNDKYRPVAHFRAIFSDTAWKGMENQGKGDYACIAAIGIWRFGERFERIVLDQTVSNEMTSDEGADEFVRMMKKWSIIHCAPQAIGEKTFESQLRAKARSAGVFPVFINLKGWTSQRKEARVSELASGARQGGMMYMEDLKHLSLTKTQIEEHPAGLHDDIPDCWADSFSPEIVDKWVPVGIEPYVRPGTPDMYANWPMATRHTGLPVLYA